MYQNYFNNFIETLQVEHRIFNAILQIILSVRIEKPNLPYLTQYIFKLSHCT